MIVKRIVPNFACPDPGRVRDFYENSLELEVVMDHGWILTFAADISAKPQISIASEGGSGTPVPDISIEVEDVDIVYERMKTAGYEIAYNIADEPWGVRRFYVRDPTGRLVNILAHAVD
ncbi:VOC family protein [Phyllobacterium zundukense]|uniref:VOC family protein n=1 Tax=Phyllobacterium zundukense TaxID=1867719 RepID=A0ACD4D4I0_9HYPH|nr:VOC family protein [Phyllobacterium zundukense]UXN60747.1 VOC family protein [Phyllobacterium zundukense]